MALEAVSSEGDRFALGFEHYPQGLGYDLYGGPEGKFIFTDKISASVLQSNAEMNLQPVIKVFDNEHIHSYTAVAHNTDGHGGWDESPKVEASMNQGGTTSSCTLQVTNFSSPYGDTRVPIVHLQGKNFPNILAFIFGFKIPGVGTVP